MQFDKVIHILAKSTTKSGLYNEPQGSYSPIMTLYAKVNYRGGREGMYARQVVATGSVVFQTRYKPGIDETMKVVYEGKTYEIEYIEPVGRNQYMNIHTKYRDNNPTLME